MTENALALTLSAARLRPIKTINHIKINNLREMRNDNIGRYKKTIRAGSLENVKIIDKTSIGDVNQ